MTNVYAMHWPIPIRSIRFRLLLLHLQLLELLFQYRWLRLLGSWLMMMLWLWSCLYYYRLIDIGYVWISRAFSHARLKLSLTTTWLLSEIRLCRQSFVIAKSIFAVFSISLWMIYSLSQWWFFSHHSTHEPLSAPNSNIVSRNFGCSFHFIWKSIYYK